MLTCQHTGLRWWTLYLMVECNYFILLLLRGLYCTYLLHYMSLTAVITLENKILTQNIVSKICKLNLPVVCTSTAETVN